MAAEDIKAMLAHKYNPDKADYPAYIQPKLDGVRCLFTAKGAFSRTGKQFMNVQHIEQQLKTFFAANPNAVLDGELYNHELKDDFEKIISLVRKTKPTAEHRKEAAELVQYHVYDVPTMTIAGYSSRLKYLNSQLSLHILWPVMHVETKVVLDYDEAVKQHKKYLKLGYEGSIYRSMDGKYKGTRSWDLMKFKDFDDAEATIVGYEVGKGKRQGTLGKFIMQDDEGITFGCPPGKGYDYKDLADMLNNISHFIGERATFTYFQRTKAGSYRHPLYKCIRNYE
jgi:DNA ligase-1